ncbi:MAG: ABC transporter substrate-binding protein [Candidatus Ancillula sp.]|jgi:D-methionine transport system substrate-binding protein|nr:ABC transporter substrate-binding protein [Candidatus Ancillula sp.]
MNTLSLKKVAGIFLALALMLAFALALTSCGEEKAEAEKGSKGNPVKIGVVGASDSQWDAFKKAAEVEGIYVEIKDFSEYSEPNPALTEGALDLNEFQHILYLAKYNVDADQDLVPVGATAVYPISLWGDRAKDVTSLESLEDGDQVAIPDDGTNQSRAIFLLKNAGLVKLIEGHSEIVTPADIDRNESKVTVYPVTASQTAISLSDPKIKAAIINNDFVKNLSEENKDNSLYTEDGDSEGAKPYINVFVARHADEDNALYLKLAQIFNSDGDTQLALAKEAGGSDKINTLVNATPINELKDILETQEALYKASK